MMTRQLSPALIAIVATIGLSASSLAQEPSRQEPPARPGQTRPVLKPGNADPGEQPEPASRAQETDEAMRRVLADLSTQIGLLSGEVRRLRRETERNSGMMELLLNEDRLAKVEDKIQEANANKAQLDAREQDIQRRMRNIQGELLLRGGLRRDEAEAAIRNDLQRALDDTRSQQASQHQRIAELTEQAVRLRARVETVRKKLELLEVKSGKEEK